MRFLGIDPGEKRIGLAVGDDIGIASPLPALTQAKLEARWNALTAGVKTQRITELRPYAEKAREVLRAVAWRAGAEEGAHPLLIERPVKRSLILVITSDRGLAGAFNSSIQRAADRQVKELADRGHEVTLATIGRKGRDFFRRRNVDIRHDFSGVPEGNAE